MAALGRRFGAPVQPGLLLVGLEWRLPAGHQHSLVEGLSDGAAFAGARNNQLPPHGLGRRADLRYRPFCQQRGQTSKQRPAGTIAQRPPQAVLPGGTQPFGLAQITGGSLSFANGIEVVRTIRNDLRIEGADPGLARATGQVTSRFADTLLLDDATGNAAIELEFEYRISDTRRLTVTLHEAYLALAKTPIQGPAGVQATFDLRAAYNATAGHMMTVSLRNGVENYA